MMKICQLLSLGLLLMSPQAATFSGIAGRIMKLGRGLSRLKSAQVTSRRVFAATTLTVAAGASAGRSEEGAATRKTIKKIGGANEAPVATQAFPPLPIVYRPEYNISLFWGCDGWIHPFDGEKYGKVAHHLCKVFGFSEQSFHKPEKISDAQLLEVHTPAYLASLKNSSIIAGIATGGLAATVISWFPNAFLQRKLLDPMRYATQGTINAVELALKHGIGINLSGGYHHARTEKQQSGFCFFADIPLAIRTIRQKYPACKKILIVDLDAHQGNGHLEARPNNDHNTFIFDMFSWPNYPGSRDSHYFRSTDKPIPLEHGISEEKYLSILTTKLGTMVDKVKPDLIIFNAGSDVYAGDPLGKMKVSADGIVRRDAHVFELARSKNIPVAMTLSGGYSKESAGIVSRSIENILRKHCAELKPVALQAAAK